MKRIFSGLIAGAMLLSVVPVLAAEEPIIYNDFESGELGFGVRGTATVELSADTAHSGGMSMLISGRGTNAWEGVNRSIVNDIKLDETYYGQMYVKAATPGESFTVKMSLDLEDERGYDYPQVGSATVNSSEWTLVEGTWKADYQGNLKALNIDLETDENGAGKSFYVDDVFFAHESVSKPKAVETIPESNEKKLTYSGIAMPSDVEGTACAEDVEKLMAMGVISGYPDGSFKPENQVTRAEYLTMLLRLLKIEAPSGKSGYSDVADDHFASGAIAWATGVGICEGYGDGIFGPENPVTYAQAVKMLMSVMGYSVAAERNGGYPQGYMAVAAAEHVAVSNAGSIDSVLTRAMTAELLCSSFNVDLYMKNGSGDMIKEKDKTILSEYYDGDETKGYVISGNDVSTNGEKTGIDVVNIDGTDYKTGITRASELVGYYVNFIYEEIDDERTLLYICPQTSKTVEFELDSRDIESYADYKYEYDAGNGRTKNVKIDRDFTLVINGQTLSGAFDDSMMVPELGSVKLVGTDSNSYNMVYITSYETLIVSSVNKTTGDVYDINNTKRRLDDSDGDITFLKADGSEGSIADVRKNDILHILKSADGDKMTVKIVRSTVDGTVDMLDDEEISIDGNVYELSQAYINREYTAPKIGTTVTAYLDINGEVVYLDEGSDTSMSVGYILGAAVLESGDELQVKYFTSDGNVATSLTDGTVKIDGKSYSDSNMNAMLGAICGNDNSGIERRIFRYSKNSSGKINKLDFARAQKNCITESDKSEGEQTLYTVNDKYVANDGKQNSTSESTVKYKYKHNARTFIDESGNYASLALNPNTIIFKIPDKGSGKETDYSEYEIASVSSLGYDEEFKVFAYKTGTDGLTADYAVLFVNNSGDENISSQEGYVVTKVTATLNRDKEEVKCIQIYKDGEKKEFVCKNSDVWEDAVAANDNKAIAKGDIVRFDTDSYGQISNLTVDKGKGKYNDYFYSAQGYIYYKEDGYAYFTTKKPNSSMSFDDMLLIPIDDFKVTVYNKRNNDVYEGVADEIIDYMTDPENYSSVYITMSYENAKTLICITDN